MNVFALITVAILSTGCALFNLSPIIESSPEITARIGQTYTYQVISTDANDDALTYSLLVYPEGMNINASTGLITWLPENTGNYDVTLEVSDGSQLVSQSFSITVDKVSLASIAVLPASMNLKIGQSMQIVSILAYFSDGTESILALADCTYESDKPATATVDSNGVIKGIASCTASTAATITVSYSADSITVIDTVSVIVSNPSPG